MGDPVDKFVLDLPHTHEGCATCLSAQVEIFQDINGIGSGSAMFRYLHLLLNKSKGDRGCNSCAAMLQLDLLVDHDHVVQPKEVDQAFDNLFG